MNHSCPPVNLPTPASLVRRDGRDDGGVGHGGLSGSGDSISDVGKWVNMSLGVDETNILPTRRFRAGVVVLLV